MLTSTNKIKQKSTDDGSMNLSDLFFYLLSYWYWFVLAVVVCLSLAAFMYAKSSFVYKSTVTVVIKDPSNTRSAARLDNYNNLINNADASVEMLIFKSKRIMTEVVNRLDADVSYSEKVKLRNVELYNGSPINVTFTDDLEDRYVKLIVKPKNDDNIAVQFDGKSRMIALNDSIPTSYGHIIISPNSNYGPDWFGKEITVEKYPAGSAAATFLGRLEVRQPEEESMILNLSFQDYNPQRAADVLNTLIAVYNEDAISDKNQIAVNTANFIDERIRIINAQLGEVEGELETFKTSHVLMDANETATMYLNDTRASGATIVDLDTKLSLANYIKEYIADPTKSDEMIPSNTGLDDLRTEGLINQYNTTKLKRDRLLEDSSLKSPVIQGLDASLASMRENIDNSIDNLIVSIEVKRNDAVRQQNKSQASFSQMPSTARKMISIERQQTIKESLYLFLLNKREENALTQAMVDNNARIIDPAEPYWGHIAPNKRNMLLLGFLLGLAIPAIILIARLFLDTNVYTRKEIEHSVDVPFVGEIPLAYKSRKEQLAIGDKKLFYNEKGRTALTEAMRSLCVNVDFMGEQKTGGKVLTLSSFLANAGKTFVAVNMASCLADNKKRVVLVDFDLRKRALSRYFDICHKTIGVSHYLYDETLTIDDILHKDVLPGVDMIPAGMVPPNPVELLQRKRLDVLIENLRQDYDYIVLDNVPVDVVIDAVIVNRVVDVTLFVLRSGSVDKRMLSMLESIYENKRLNNIGIILNGSQISKHYGYSYGYGYGYGYDYGYGYQTVYNGDKRNNDK